MNDAPRVHTKHGSFEIPADIIETADGIVSAYMGMNLPDGLGVNEEDMLGTMIATALLQERLGFGRRSS